jgi:hypothetical protein
MKRWQNKATYSDGTKKHVSASLKRLSEGKREGEE